MKNSKYIGILILLSTVCCKGTNKIEEYNNEKKDTIKENQYYKDFTDATKHALLGNYRSAITLYNLCIQEFPEKAAPYYQLSSLYMRAQEYEIAKDYAIKAEYRDQENIWYKINLANIYQFMGKLDSAAFIYEEIIGINPDPELMYNLALLYNQNSENKKALEVISKLEDRYDGSKELLLLKHNVFHSQRKYDSALVQLQLITKYFPDDINNYGLLAEYCAEIGKTQYAKSIYKEIIRKDSKNGLALLSFAEFYIMNKESDSAFYYYNKAFCCSDLNFEDKISVLIGFISEKEFVRKHKDKIEEILKILNRISNDYRIFASYADIYINLEDYKKAKSYLDSALLYNKENYLLWEQALLINYYTKDYSHALKISSEARKYFNEKPNVYLISALSNKELGNNDSTIIEAEKVLKMNCDDQNKIQALNILADVYREKKLYSRSDSCYEEILKIEPENLMIRNNYSYYLSIREEKLEKAEELSRFTIIREPDNPTYLDTYGWIMFKMNKVKEAKNYIESAIRNGAYNNPEVLDHYGEIMLKLDKCKEAIEAWEKIPGLDSTYMIKEKINTIKADCYE